MSSLLRQLGSIRGSGDAVLQRWLHGGYMAVTWRQATCCGRVCRAPDIGERGMGSQAVLGSSRRATCPPQG